MLIQLPNDCFVSLKPVVAEWFQRELNIKSLSTVELLVKNQIGEIKLKKIFKTLMAYKEINMHKM